MGASGDAKQGANTCGPQATQGCAATQGVPPATATGLGGAKIVGERVVGLEVGAEVGVLAVTAQTPAYGNFIESYKEEFVMVVMATTGH